MSHNKEHILQALSSLYERPKDRIALETLNKALEVVEEGRVCFLTPIVSMGKNLSETCSNFCPLSQVVTRTVIDGKEVSRWFRCPCTDLSVRRCWQEKQSEADIMQRCLEAIAVLKALDS